MLDPLEERVCHVCYSGRRYRVDCTLGSFFPDIFHRAKDVAKQLVRVKESYNEPCNCQNLRGQCDTVPAWCLIRHRLVMGIDRALETVRHVCQNLDEQAGKRVHRWN